MPGPHPRRDDPAMATSVAAQPLLRELVAQAVLAPSSHNAQPWRFHTDGGVLELLADRTRALPVNDPHDRELTLSCGAALLNARVAAEHHGHRLDVGLLPRGPGDDLLARAVPRPGGRPDGLFAAIAARRTVRHPFGEHPVAEEDLDALGAAAKAEGARLAVLDARQRRTLVELVADGDRTLFADAARRRELAATLPSPVTRFVVGHVGVGGPGAGHDAKLAARAPVLALLATPGDAPLDWLRGGQALERVLLTAASRGLQASFLNQPIRVEALRPRVGALLGAPGHPQVALRLGYPVRVPPPAPRRPVDDVIQR